MTVSGGGIPYERLVLEDLELGYGTVSRSMPGGGSATGNKLGLHTWTGAVNVKSAGAIGDGAVDDTQAIVAAIAALPNGGIVYFPSGTYKTSSLITIATNGICLCGAGRSSVVQASSTTGAFLVTAHFSGFDGLCVNYTGTGAYGVKFDNGTSLVGTGVLYPFASTLMVSGTAGTSHGVWLVNSIHGTFRDLYLPGGGGDALRLEASGFHSFVNTKISVNLGDSLTHWTNGVTLQSQSGNTTFQADDNSFVQTIVEGVTAKGLYIGSVIGAGLTPSRNSFYKGTIEGNGWNIHLEDCKVTNFYGFHTESAARDIEIGASPPATGIGDNPQNISFQDCQGGVTLHEPFDAIGIKDFTFEDYTGNITIEGPKVQNVRIVRPIDIAIVSNLGTNTTLDGACVDTNGKVIGSFEPGVPAAAANAVQGSGGSFVTIATPPSNTSGWIHVVGRQNTTAALARYSIPYVSGSAGLGLGTPSGATSAVFGATTAQMTFQVSSFSIQAKGANATAPDSVYVRIDVQPLSI